MARLLIVSTSFGGKLDNSDLVTGSWVEEIATPYFIWKQHGFQVDISSIKGGEIPFDPASKEGDFLTPQASAFLKDPVASDAVKTSKSISELVKSRDALNSYDAVFLPGGHGIVFDGPGSAELKELLGKFCADGKVIGAVCHGPAALVSATKPSGEPLVKGMTVTGFTNTEEVAVGKDKNVPFLLEDKLKELGGTFVRGEADWAPFAVRDGNLITGQNPASSARVAELVVEAVAPHVQPQHGKGPGEGFIKRGHDFTGQHHDHTEAHAKIVHPQANSSQWHSPMRQSTHTSPGSMRGSGHPDKSYTG